MAAFGWAINQLKMDRTVRRAAWPENILHLAKHENNLIQTNSTNTSFAYFLNTEDIFAEDWGAGTNQEASKPPENDAIF